MVLAVRFEPSASSTSTATRTSHGRADLRALHHGADRGQHLARDGDAFLARGFGSCGSCHALENRVRHRDAQFVLHELGIAHADQRPDAGDHRNPAVLDALAGMSPAGARSKTGWVTAYSAPASTLYSKRRISSSILGSPGLAPTPITKPVPAPIGIAADIEAAIQVVDDVHQPDGVHVEHRGRVGIVAHLRRIAGDADQVANADRGRAQQVRLDAQHVAVAAGVVQDRLDADLAAAPAATRPGCSCGPRRAGCREC